MIQLLGFIAVLCTYMRPIVSDRGAWSVSLSVSRSVTLVSPAKTAQPIEMPFGLRTLVGPGNHVLWGSRSPWERAILGKGASHCKVQGHPTVICEKTAEPIEMPFGWWARTIGYGGGLSGRPTKCRYCRYPAAMGYCHGNHFLAFYI